jgi:hypothetical protein
LTDQEVKIRIGKRHYRVCTALDEPTFDRVVALVNEVNASLDSGVDQERLLALTCLRLAYGLDKISDVLASLENVPENSRGER